MNDTRVIQWRPSAGRAEQLMPGKKSVAIPLIQAGPVANVNDANLNVAQTFTVTMIRGDRRKGEPWTITNADNGSAVFDKPVDNIGTKTIADYAGYAAKHVYNINIPNCATPGRLFVGQRRAGVQPAGVFIAPCKNRECRLQLSAQPGHACRL